MNNKDSRHYVITYINKKRRMVTVQVYLAIDWF